MEDGDVVLKSSDAEYYVLVRDTVLNAFTNLVHDELVRLPPPATEQETEIGGE